MLSMLHHVHHRGSHHAVHHCGGPEHGARYRVEHCRCGLHRINFQFIETLVHAPNEITVVMWFPEACPAGGWHVESGCRYEAGDADLLRPVAAGRRLTLVG